MEKLVNRYSNALLSILEEKDELESGLQQAELIREVFSSKEIQTFFTNPDVRDSEKQAIIKDNFKEEINNDFMGFLNLMVRNSRESLISPVLTELMHQIKAKLGIIEAEVVSAHPLEEEQQQAIRNLLVQKLNKEIEVNNSIDPDLLGGFYILIEGRVFDSSIKADLNKMAEQLKRGDYRGN